MMMVTKAIISDTRAVPRPCPEVAAEVVRAEEKRFIGINVVVRFARHHLVDGRYTRADADGGLLASLGIERRDDFVIRISAEKRRGERQKNHQQYQNQPNHGALVADKVRCDTLPVALGSIVGVGRNVCLLQLRKVPGDRDVFRCLHRRAGS